MPFSARKQLELHLNENPYPFSPECLDLFDNFNLKQFSYYSKVSNTLKEKISNTFSIPLEQVIVSNGAEDMLKQSFFWLLKEKDTILLPNIGWHYYQKIAHQVKANVVLYNMIEHEDSFSYDIDQILSLLKTHKVKLMFITSPSNPGGGLIKKTELEPIIQALSKDTLCIIDEAYWGFVEPDYSYKEIVEKYPVLILRTFSKLFALAGLRVGFAFANKRWEGFTYLMDRYLGLNHFSELIAITALNSMDFYKKSAETILQEGEKYYHQFKALGIKVFTTKANFIFARLKSEHFRILKDSLKDYHIIIKFFDSNKEPQFKNCVRITIGLPKENEYVIQTISALIEGK